jgi:hypothetical protein
MSSEDDDRVPYNTTYIVARSGYLKSAGPVIHCVLGARDQIGFLWLSIRTHEEHFNDLTSSAIDLPTVRPSAYFSRTDRICDGNVRNNWQCDGCHISFETSALVM